MASKERLEGIAKLAGVPLEILGAKNVSKFLKGRAENVRRNPRKVSEILSHRLSRRFEAPSYLPSPERVGGISRNLYLIGANEEMQDYHLRASEQLNGLCLNGFEIFYNYRGLTESSIATSTRVLYPFFVNANEVGLNNDESFGRVAHDFLIYLYKGQRERISEYEIYDNWVRRMGVNILGVDWKTELSVKQFNKSQADEYRTVVLSSFPISIILDRMHERGIGNQYDRELLCRWLGEIGSNSFSEAQSFANRHFQFIQDRLDKCRGENAADCVVENWERLTKSIGFIRDVLLREREFVKDYFNH